MATKASREQQAHGTRDLGAPSTVPLTSAGMIDLATPVVERVVRKRFFGASLSPSDDRYENERARDCVQQALLELWAKFSRVEETIDPPIQNLANYAARVAHNAVNEVVRPPAWTRVKHRMLRVVSKNHAFAAWDDAELGRVVGYVGWKAPAKRPSRGLVTELRQLTGDLRADALLATQWENMNAAHWARLLERLFDAADGPVSVTTLVYLLVELFGIRPDSPLTSPDPDHDV